MRTSKFGSGAAPRRRRPTCCCYTTMAIVLFVVVLLLVLALTVFRPKQTITTVNSVKLDGVKLGFSFANLGVDLNATVLLNISVTNPNKAGFVYDNGTAELHYRGILVGVAAIPAGEIGPGETINTVIRLTVLADRLLSDGSVYSDIMSGPLAMATSTRIAGKVTVLRFFKKSMVMYTTCDVAMDVVGRTVANSNCKSRTKF